MHKYLIELMRYTEDGAPTNDYTYDYADTPQGLADKVSKYNRMRYTAYEDDGNVHAGGKMYKVTPMQGAYQPIADWNAFVEMNCLEYYK